MRVEWYAPFQRVQPVPRFASSRVTSSVPTAFASENGFFLPASSF